MCGSHHLAYYPRIVPSYGDVQYGDVRDAPNYSTINYLLDTEYSSITLHLTAVRSPHPRPVERPRRSPLHQVSMRRAAIRTPALGCSGLGDARRVALACICCFCFYHLAI